MDAWTRDVNEEATVFEMAARFEVADAAGRAVRLELPTRGLFDVSTRGWGLCNSCPRGHSPIYACRWRIQSYAERW